MRYALPILLGVALSPLGVCAQEARQGDSPGVRTREGWHTSLGIQSDLHYSTDSDETGRRFLGNTYISGIVRNKSWEIGLRLEELSHPLPGYEEGKGWGLPNVYVKRRYRFVDVTLGDFYEQFGSGMLLRAYEDRSLGLDNSIRGGRLTLHPLAGATIKLLGGQQRNYFDRKGRLFNRDRGYLWGADADLMLGEWLKLTEDWGINLGLSWVTKAEEQDEINQMIGGQLQRLVQPRQVGGMSARLRVQKGSWDIFGEYGYKSGDPNATNGYIFRDGSAVMLTASYARRGLSIFAGARRSENFDFRSDRGAMQNAMRINYLQPFTQQQTYTLAALYPYATQPNGEWAFQTEVRYKAPRHSWLGGRYGTDVKLSASYVTSTDKKWIDPSWGANPSDPNMVGSDGYRSNFFGLGEAYFHDINLEVSKKVSRSYSFVLAYMNQRYNQRAIEGHADNGDVVRSNIFIYDGKHRLSQQVSLRTELQYLQTRQAEGDQLYGLVEWSLLPRFVFSLSDQWNAGSTRKHYYMLSASGSFGSHRVQISYGRTRKGINCSGGVCRVMPATEGIYLSYNFNY